MQNLNLENAAILDTETTGLGEFAEIVEISIIDAMTGESLFTSLVKPVRSIPQDAINVHGITNEMVELAQPFDLLWPFIKDAIAGRTLIIYNADYDTRLMIQSLRARAFPKTPIRFENTVCAMEWYSEFWGEWNEFHGNYKWQSLSNACRQQGIDTSKLTAHRALADCKMTLSLIQVVNAKLNTLG